MKTLAFAILFIFTSMIHANQNFDQSMNRLEGRLTDIVKSFDERAQVLVFATEMKNNKSVKLPSLPFLVTSVEGDEESLKLAKLEITVFSRLEALPPEIEASLIRLAKEYFPNPQLKVNKISSFKEKSEDPVQKISKYLPHAAAVLGVFTLLFLVVYVRRGSQLKSVLESQFSMLAKSFADSAGNSGSQPVAVQSQESSSSKSSIEINTSASSQWEEYSTPSLIAVLADCYWCHDDEYASFIWKKINISKRNEVLESGKIPKEYAAYLSNVEGEDKGYVDEPYYLDPLPIEHLSNDELLKVVKENGSFIKKISRLRANSLPLKAKERLEIYNSIDETKPIDKSYFGSIEASETRTLQEKVNFRFSSIEEESEVVSLDDMSYENMRQFPSLAWLTKINQEEAVDILGSYTAKQLASVWVGPERVLRELEELIPSKKRDLLASYLQSVIPNRNHPIYEEIINLALDSIKEENSSKDDSSTQKAA